MSPVQSIKMCSNAAALLATAPHTQRTQKAVLCSTAALMQHGLTAAMAAVPAAHITKAATAIAMTYQACTAQVHGTLIN